MSRSARCSLNDAPGYIFRREPFNCNGTLIGQTDPAWSTGMLNRDETDKFYAVRSEIDYVVYSYATPIAWHTPTGGWYKVRQKFSVTTSRHQSRLYLVHEGSSYMPTT